MGYARLVRWQLRLLHGAVYGALTADKSAHGHGGKAEKNGFWRELRHKACYCCFGWAVYAPLACLMGLWMLCLSKLAKCPLICLADLAGDLKHKHEIY